jgi:phosphoribosylformylglycinamidine cyclo-ligase
VSGRERRSGYTYRDAGVDSTAGSRAKEHIGQLVRGTYNDQVLGDFGHFGGMFLSPGGGDAVLVSSADSVGTKVLLAVHSGQHQSIGIDLVNHCVNDILCCGARPLFFLDYFATSVLDEEILADLVSGMAQACKEAGCALIGGETAQLPGIYREGTYDLAGFIVGSVDRDAIIDGSAIEAGQAVVGFASNGLHTNGYSLARAVFGLEGDDHEGIKNRLQHDWSPLGESLGEALLRPHPSYLGSVTELASIERPTGLAHITGGGIAGNLERIIPEQCTAEIHAAAWEHLPIFDLVQRTGDVDASEMYRVFNMGIGYIAVVSRETAETFCNGRSDAFLIGEIRRAESDGKRVEIRGISDT